MIRALRIKPRGCWEAKPAGQLHLDSVDRRRRRYVMRCADGFEFLLDLQHAPQLREGDALVLEDGRHIAVHAAVESLTEIRARDIHHLVELSYHIGNRHLEAQIAVDRILIRRDHVIENMLRGLGATIAHVDEPFDPLPGAYDHGSHRHG